MQKYIFFLILVLLAGSVSAIGVSPPRIFLESIPKNYVLEKSVTLSGIEEGSTVTISFSGEGSDWIKSKLGNSFIKQDNQDLKLPFIISIPKEAPNGEYEVSAQVVASSKQKIAKPNSAAVSSGILVNIKFTVSGKEIRKYKITNVMIPDTETGLPVAIVMKINNEGNVLIKPSEVEITIKDKEKKTITSSASKEITSVEPYTAGESIVTFNLGLDPGFYFADVNIHLDESTQKVENIPFEVFEKGAFKADGELTALVIDGDVDKIAKIVASFINNGEIDMYSILKAEIYKENTLVDVIESEQEYVRKGDTKKFTHYYNVPSSGEYKVKAHIEFLGKETNTKEVVFKTLKTGLKIGDYHVITAAIIVVLILLIAIRAKKKKDHKK